MQIVVRDPKASLNNPCVLITPKRIFLMVQRYPVAVGEYTVKPGYDLTNSCSNLLLTSDDDGKTWNKPRDLTRESRPADVLTLASGPGIGIQLKSGRLVFPFNEGYGGGRWSTFALYSDDFGLTWQRGQPTPRPAGLQPNEVQFVELTNGDLLQNARNQAAGKFRLQARSDDRGVTWSEATPVPALVDPVCMGSIIRLSWTPDLIAFSNPAHPRKRERGLLRTSVDGGKTWSQGLLLEPGSFAYSSLVSLGSRRVGVLYEHVEKPERYRILYREVILP
jgi:sialidase-1